MGAAAKLDTQLEIALALGYLRADMSNALAEELGEIMVCYGIYAIESADSR